jgi:GR25 family glycosyltransferase involved in LPS biosynthesis
LYINRTVYIQNMPNEVEPNEANKLVFYPSGRLGNAIFRYMACAIVNTMNPALEYTLLADVQSASEHFTYYPGLDQEGCDLYKTKETDHAAMQKEAMQDTMVMGFNTLGYFKHTIDLAQLTTNLYINKENGQGLYVKKNLTITDENFFNMFYKKLENFHVSMDGFFHFGYIYLKYKRQILNYMEAHKAEHFIQTDRNERYLMRDILDDMVLPVEKHYDMAIHIRLDDFNGRADFIELEHYLALFATLLPQMQDQRICIVYQGSRNAKDAAYIHACLQWFHTHNVPVTIEANALLVDFNIMKQAKSLICSMSTLAWTAAYLSKHIQQCYMPNYNFHGTERSDVFFHKPIENTVLYNVKTSPKLNIKPHIITLPEFSGRLGKLDGVMHALATIGMDTNVFYGVYGKDIQVYDAASKVTGIKHITWQGTTYFYDMRVRLNGNPMTKGEFGCAWSHLNILRQLVAEPPGTYYLIMEDDVELVKPLKDLHELLQNVPADTDICHLCKSIWYPIVLTQKVNEYFYECKKQFFSHATAYLISQKGAQKVLDYTNNYVNVPADDLYNMIYRLTQDFHLYAPAEFYFKEQDNVTSTIKSIDS